MSLNTLENSKRIAKNTILLYGRMLLMMFVSLYTSRVVLNALGVEDYGIYNVVGGVVAMFSVVSGSLSAAISRFLTFELGKNDIAQLKRIFSTSVIIQFILALIVLVLIETVGLWFLNNKLVIPESRMVAANWVFQLSIITFVFGLMNVPYGAAIIAHEKMSAFAYLSILDATEKLLIAFLVAWTSADKLILYAILMCFVSLLGIMIYRFYCKRKFEECSFQILWDKTVLKRMFGFAGWNFIGASSAILRDQGGNIIINMFCGPAVNAARGIALQVNGAVSGFATNFMTALNPQITKSYASGEQEYMMKLIFQGARLSFYMLLFLSVPIWANTHFILVTWLKIVPEHSVLFVQLILLYTMMEALSTPLITAMMATGEIKKYQIIVGGTQMLNLPLSYILLCLGAIPEMVLVVALVISQLCLAERLLLLRKMINLPSVEYLKKVYLNVLFVLLLSCIVPILLSYYLQETFLSFIIISFVSVLFTGLVIYFIGCQAKERKFVMERVWRIKTKMLRK